MNRRIVKWFLAGGIVLAACAVLGWLLVVRGPRPPRHVILISIDTLRADHVGCYGFRGGITPTIDALASDGLRFARCASPAPLTVPGHATMLTGSIPPVHGAHHNEDVVGPANVILAEQLSEAGFVTGAIVSASVLDAQAGLYQGFDTYADDLPMSPRGVSYSQRRAEATSQLACQWLAEHAEDDHFFLLLHYYDPHTPYDPPQPYASRFPTNAYAGEVAYVDRSLAQVIDELKRLDLYEQSLIILTSDHGEMLGSHGEQTHSYFVYEPAIQVPLIVKLPGGQYAGTVVDEMAGLVDIVPTVCSLLGLKPAAQVSGRDLLAPLDSDRMVYCESMTPQRYDANGLWALAGRRWKYVHTTVAELYDLQADPTERINLADRQPQQVRVLADRLAAILDSAQPVGPSDVAGPERLAELRALGYVAGATSAARPFDAGKDDPKGLLDFHIALARVVTRFEPEGRTDEALALLQELVQQRPGVADVRVLLAVNLSRAGRHDEAMEQYDALIDIDGDNPEWYVERGRGHWMAGRIDAALADFNRTLSLSPRHVLANMNRGLIHAERGVLAQAVADFTVVINTDATFGGAYYHRALARLKLGDRQGALDDLTACLTTTLTPTDRQKVERLRQQVLGVN